MDQGTRSVVDAGRSVSDELDVKLILERMLESARTLTGAGYATLEILDQTQTELARFLTVGVGEAARWLADVAALPGPQRLPAGDPPLATFVGVPVLVAGQTFGTLYLTDRQGVRSFSNEDEQAARLLAEFAGVAIDHVQRYSGVEARQAEPQHTVSALDATLQIARALGGETDLGTILELVAKRGRVLVSARALVIELRRAEELEVAAAAGDVPPDLVGQRVDLKDTVASAALRTRRSQHLADAPNRVRFELHGLGLLGLHAADGLVVPLLFRDHAYGVLVAVDQLQTGGFSDEQQRLLEALAVSAAAAVATAQSAADERRLQSLAAAEAERTRWARELHDDTLQGLGILRLTLAAAQRDGHPDALRTAVRQALEQLGSDIANLRGLITDLRPAALDQLGIEAAVMALVDRARRSGLAVDVSMDLAYEQGHASTRYISDLETAIYRIVQEALTNATKHGQAKRAVVEIHEDERDVRVVVRDDGHGFDPGDKSPGFGLPGMRERAELLGGALSIESAAGSGTMVSASLPVRRRSSTVQPPTGSAPDGTR
jgi:signal transduction histidine kinase